MTSCEPCRYALDSLCISLLRCPCPDTLTASASQANSASVEEALYQKLQEALFQLQEESQRKLNLLLSEELELRRQMQQIDWSESFVTIMQVRRGGGGGQ